MTAVILVILLIISPSFKHYLLDSDCLKAKLKFKMQNSKVKFKIVNFKILIFDS